MNFYGRGDEFLVTPVPIFALPLNPFFGCEMRDALPPGVVSRSSVSHASQRRLGTPLVLEFQMRGLDHVAEFGDVAVDDFPEFVGRRAAGIDGERL
jgi:hypothetical protein